MTSTRPAESEPTRVAGLIRNQIIDGERTPGSKLVERELAAELNVSRVPVREALKILVAEGLVTPRPRTWAIVREFSARDIAEINELRTTLEVLAFSRAARRHTDIGLRELEKVLEIEEEAAQAGDVVAARRAAVDFHDAVVSLAGNQHLQETWQSINSKVRWILSQHDDLVVIARDHRILFEAIARRNEEEVSRLVMEHAATGQKLLARKHSDT